MAHKDPVLGWLPDDNPNPDQMLSDVKVLDLGHHIAGPYATRLLAGYGADVIKVENPDGGDIARRRGPFPDDIPHPEKSGTFIYLNCDKRGVTLNLATETGRRILRELAKDVDIVVENFEPRKMAEWGLTYDSLAAANPKLVMTSISNFGQWGPYRDFRATDIVIFGMGGAMIATGKTGREPLKLYDETTAYQVALDAGVATMAALLYARATGEGQHIDVSMFEAMMGSIDRRGNYLVNYAYSGRRETYRITETTADGLFSALGFPCKDGYVQFTGMTQRNFERFARWTGHPELIDDPNFATPEQRREEMQRGITDALGQSFLLDHTVAELMDSMERHQIPGGCVYTVEDVVEDPHTQTRGFIVEIEHPAAGKVPMPWPPVRPLETPAQLRRPAPLLGQHNEEVYCGMLGYTKEDLVRLRESGII